MSDFAKSRALSSANNTIRRINTPKGTVTVPFRKSAVDTADVLAALEYAIKVAKAMPT